MKKFNILKKLAAGILVLTAAAVVGAQGVEASILGNNDDTDLGDLIILDQLFGVGGISGTSTTGRNVVVQPGDTLSGIASVYLGSASSWPAIASLNNLSNPDLIFPGQVLALPAAADGDAVGGLFGGSGNLGNLFILEELFGDSDIFGSGDLDLGDLFILDALFGGGTGGMNLFGGGSGNLLGGNLGQLFILEELFGDSNIFD